MRCANIVYIVIKSGVTFSVLYISVYEAYMFSIKIIFALNDEIVIIMDG